MILASTLVATVLVASQPGPAAPPMDAAAWREDLKFLAEELPRRHLEPFHTISREEWDRRVAELDAAIPTLEDHQVVARLAALVASIGDAHTQLNTRDRFGQYPFQFKTLPDGVYVVGATPEHADLLGARLISIDGTDADRAREAVSPLATRENDVTRRMQTTRLLAVPEALHAFGVAKSVDRAVFILDMPPATGAPEGSEVERELTPLERGKPVNWKIPDSLTAETGPIYIRDQRLAYWWRWLDDGSILYVAYNRCESDPKRPFPGFAKEVLEAIDGHKPAKVAIDLRNNGGGNSAVAAQFLMALRENTHANQRGRLFVLIGARTASSAMMNALQLRNGTEAILVGEPSRTPTAR